MNSNTPDPHSAEEMRSRTDSEQIIQALNDGKNKRVRKHLLRRLKTNCRRELERKKLAEPIERKRL